MFSDFFKVLGIALLIVAFILGAFFIEFSVDQANIVSKQKTEGIIVDVDIISTKHDGNRSVFTVRLDDDTTYTLPSISTNTVREYYIDDALPIIINIYKDGSRNIIIDSTRLNKAEAQPAT